MNIDEKIEKYLGKVSEISTQGGSLDVDVNDPKDVKSFAAEWFKDPAKRARQHVADSKKDWRNISGEIRVLQQTFKIDIENHLRAYVEYLDKAATELEIVAKYKCFK